MFAARRASEGQKRRNRKRQGRKWEKAQPAADPLTFASPPLAVSPLLSLACASGCEKPSLAFSGCDIPAIVLRCVSFTQPMIAPSAAAPRLQLLPAGVQPLDRLLGLLQRPAGLGQRDVAGRRRPAPPPPRASPPPPRRPGSPPPSRPTPAARGSSASSASAAPARRPRRPACRLRRRLRRPRPARS